MATYVYSYTLAGTEDQSALTVTVDLEDEAGNVQTGQVAGSFVPDFVNPSIVGTPVVNKAFAKSGDEVTVTFSSSEKLKADPVVKAGAVIFVKKGQTGNEYVYGYTLAGSETEGPANITIDLLDEADNAAGALAGGSFTVDLTAPRLSAGPFATPQVAREGTLVVVQVEASEELDAGRAVAARLGAIDMGAPVQTGRTYQFRYLAKEVDGDGDKTVKVEPIFDLAGNTAGPFDGPSVTFDFKNPTVTVTGLGRGPHRSPKAAETDDVIAHVKFTTSEALDPKAGQVAVNISGNWTAVCPEGAAAEFDCTFAVPRDLPGGDELEGLQVVAIVLKDQAGNSTVNGAGTMTFDFTAPVLTMAVEPRGRPVRLGEMVTLSVASNETLDATGVVLDSGGLLLDPPSVSGTNYTWTYTVKETDDEPFSLSATAKDAAGNPANTAATGSVTLDGVVPTMSGASLNPSRIRGGEKFELTFSASEAIPGDPDVAFSNGTDAPVSMTLKLKTGNDYVFEGTAPASGSSPYYAVTVSLEDGAGNQRSGSAGTIEIDNVAPELAGLEVAPAGAKVGDTIRVVLTADETLLGPPALVAKAGGTDLNFAAVDSTPGRISYAYTYVVTAGLWQGVYTIQPLSLSDIAGNVRQVTPNPPKTFTVDSSVPQVMFGPSFDKIPAVYKAGETISLLMQATENLDASLPTVTLNTSTPKSLPCTAGPGANFYTCALASPLSGTEAPQGQVGIGIQLSDAAGNTGFANGNVTLDFVPPALLTAGAGQARYKGSEFVYYTITVSEPLFGNPGRPVVRVYRGGAEQAGFFGPAPINETDTSFTYRSMALGHPDGDYTVGIDLTDKAGNVTPGLAGGGFSFDSATPVVTAVSVTTNNPNSSALARDSNVTTAVFSVDEGLYADPQVTLGGKTMTFVSKTGTGPWTYTYTRAAAVGDGDGTKAATVTAMDLAGNVRVQDVGSVTYDFTAPAVISSMVSPNPAGMGKVLTYTVTASETLFEPPVLHFTPVLTMQGPVQSGTQYAWTRNIDGAETQGAYTVTVDMIDLAGNPRSGAPAAGFSVDWAAPVVTPVSVTTNNPNFNTFAKNGEVVTAVFTVNGDLPSNPGVTVGGLAMSFASKSGSGPYTFTYNRTALSDDDDGTKSVTVQTADTAGNVTVYNFRLTVTYDFNPPDVTAGSGSIQLVPFGGCLLSNVTKVALNTTARVSFTANELLLADPVVTIDPSVGTWSITKYSSAGLSYTYDIKPTGGSPTQGATNVRVVLTDRAGNVSDPIALTLPSPGIDVDTAAPTPISIAQNDKILYRRVPWGSDATAGVKTFSVKTLDGEAGAVEPDATVIFWDAADTATAAEIGRITADANGYFAPKELNRADRPHVYLTQVDEACNTDGPNATELRNHEWIASMGYKVVGDDFQNPHEYRTRSYASGVLAEGGSVPVGAGDGVDTLGDTRAHVFGDGTWRRRRPSDPARRTWHAAAFDSVRGKVVVFGGMSDDLSCDGGTDGYCPGTWEWSGEEWERKIPADPEGDGDPSPRIGLKMAFDPVRGRVLLFGGYRNTLLGDFWEWDGTSWQRIWAEDPEGDGDPPPRTDSSLAFDSSRGRLVLYGGCTGWMFGCTVVDGSTWEWNGRSWKLISPADPEVDGNPAARGNHGLAYDMTRRRVVLFGGSVGMVGTCDGGATNRCDVTWEWNGVSWRKRLPAHKPSARLSMGMAFDNARDRVVVFGGQDVARLNDLWEWDGSDWTGATPLDPEGDGNPAVRSWAGVAYESVRSRLVTFGGTTDGGNCDGSGEGCCNSTWSWNGTSWTKVGPSDPDGDGKPSARHEHAIAYDNNNGRSVLFGGCAGADLPCDVIAGDTWEWTGLGWNRIIPADPGGDGDPAPRFRHALAFQKNSGRTLLFGGCGAVFGFNCSGRLGDTWEWSGTSWDLKTPADPEGDGNPSARSTHAMEFDSARNRVVLFGGEDALLFNGETWEWNGTSWAKCAPGGAFCNLTDPEGDGNPSARYYPGMAFDEVRGRVVLFGGYGPTCDGGASAYCGATWEWNGTSWAKIVPSDPEGDGNPLPRYQHALAFDSSRKMVVLFGGMVEGSSCAESGSNRCNDTWEWNGASWRIRSPVSLEGESIPGPRSLHAMAYDQRRNRMVLFAGYDGSLLGDTREWDSGAAARPSQVFQANFAAAVAPATSTWLSVAGTFYSGGVGYPGGVATNGVDLKVWDEGIWKTVVVNNSPPETPALVSWTTTDPAVISRLFFGPQQTLNFAVTPSAPNGTGTGEIAVDYAEVTVKYRL
ncbi:MAG: hypothetical protein HY897_23370 [Deltaproteobacteria bacterium]|nr:hypothetical protein [Deltaproteobacteria bacterium]